jgi:hypothetical protein
MKHQFFLHIYVFYKTLRRFLVESFVSVSECIAVAAAADADVADTVAVAGRLVADTVAVVGRLVAVAVAVAMFFVYIVVSADAAVAVVDMRVAVAVVDRV